MVAQCILFLLAGYDTVQTTLTWVTMRIAKNPHVQERLIDDILEAVEKHGQVDYDSVQDMTYLDAVIKGKSLIAKSSGQVSLGKNPPVQERFVDDNTLVVKNFGTPVKVLGHRFRIR